MKIQLIDGRIPTTPGMLAFVHSRITAALGRFAARLESIRVRISDINGPRGGVDKRCVILATVSGREGAGGRGGGEVIARHFDGDFYAAIAGAVHALKRLVARRLDRGRTKRRVVEARERRR